AQKLQKTAFVMEQSGHFSPQAVSALYHAGEQLTALTNPDGQAVYSSYEGIMDMALREDNQISDDERNALYLEMLYGKGITYSPESGMRPPIYEGRYQRWKEN